MKRLLFALALTLGPAGGVLATEDPSLVRVGAKSDVEGSILGEIVAQLARAAGATTQSRSLAGKLIWQALAQGEIDVYPEYTGTLSREILAGQGIESEDALRAALADKGIGMTQPLGFNNTYALGMKEETARRLGIKKVSDLRNHPTLKLGLSNEFLGRADGWPVLRAKYQLPQLNVRGLDHSLAYRALATGDIDVTDLYSTDAEIRAQQLRVLEDDWQAFPAYQAVLLYRNELPAHVLAALRRLEGRLSEETMTALNARVQIDKVSPARAAADFLRETLGIQSDVRERTTVELLTQYTLDHLALVGLALAAGIVVAVPLGIAAARRPRLGQLVLGAVAVLQTIPALALLVFMMALLSVLHVTSTGALPAVLALFLYSLLPMVRNTYAGLTDIPPNLRESAEALGLPPLARLWRIELPLAALTILAGIKTAAVITVGYATLGALIGAGGYGQPIVTGIQRNDVGIIVWHGAVPAAVMALAVQGLFELVERVCVPQGLRLKPEA